MTEEMTKQISRLEALQKYKPFMDYYIASGFEKSDKFKLMRDLLTSRRRQPLHILEKIETSINTRYKNLPEDAVVPEYIHQIFRIDLCSDDEDDDHNSYKKKDEDVQFVSVIHPDPDKVKTKERPSTSEYSKGLPNKIEKIDLVEDLIISCDDVDNGKIFKIEDLPWSPDVLSSNDVDNNKPVKTENYIKANSKQGSGSISVECISIDSSSDEEETQPSKDKSERSKSNETDSIISPSYKIVQNEESVANDSICSPKLNDNAEALENMDYNQIQEIFLQCLENTPNMDRETFERGLINVISASGLENATHKDSDPVNPTENSQTGVDNVLRPSNQQLNSTSCLQLENVAYHIPSLLAPTILPTHIKNIYKKINLKDPRIAKRISEQFLQNPSCPKPNVTQSKPVSNPVPTTYGEYRRTKELEEKQREEEKKRLKEEIKRYEDELKRDREERREEELKKRRHEEENKRRQEEENKRRQEEENKRRQEEKAKLHQQEEKKKEVERQNAEVKRRKTEVKNTTDPRESIMSELQPFATSIMDAIAEAKSKSNANETNHKKRVDRELKGLECTVKGYTRLQDYIPRTINGKRRSSVSARTANTEQLGLKQAMMLATSDDSEHSDSSETSASSESARNNLNQIEGSRSPPLSFVRKRRCSMSARSAFSKQMQTNESDDDAESTSKYFKISETSEDYLPHQYQIPQSITECQQTVSTQLVYTQNALATTYQSNSQQLLKAGRESMAKDCSVIVRKLTMEEIKEMTRPNTRNATGTKLPPGRPGRKKKDMKTNTDRNMFESNTRFCVLCKVKPADLTNHYIRTHKTESYVARLSPEILNELQERVRFATEMPSSSRIKKFKVECAMCKVELIDTFQNYYTHFSVHTGEYAFQCAGCQLLKPYRADIQSHQCHARQCWNAGIKTQYQYHKNIMTIHLYCCRICNFMQLNQENVFKHLREQHDKLQKDATFVQQLILCAIRDDSSGEQHSCVPSPDLPEVDDIPVCNEPLIDSYDEVDDIPVLNVPLVEGYNEVEETRLSNEPQVEGYSDEVLSKIKTEAQIPLNVAEPHDYQPPMTTVHTMLCTDGRYVHYGDAGVDSSDVGDVKSLLAKPKSLQSNGKNTPHMVYKLYPKDIEYVGLFKCLAVDCFFSTEVDSEMLQHLDDHKSSACPPAEFLECAYCRLDGEECLTAEALVAHISEKHRSSVYQCSVCCYRSCSPANVVVHVRHSHPENQTGPIVLTNRENVEYPTDRLDQMKLAMQKNVNKLNCPSCPTGFYALSFMMDHTKTTHGSVNHQWNRYACIYCGQGHINKENIQIHLADEHPAEVPYACERVLQPGQKIDNITNLLLKDVSVEVTLDQIQLGCKSVADQLNFGGDETKPSAENLLQILEETVKPLLKQVAGTTGVSPDRLFKCPMADCGGLFSIYSLWYRHMSKNHACFLINCPHCPPDAGSEMQLSSFENHFEEHRLYQFVCFCCGETFATDRQTRQHAEREHPDTGDMRIETVVIGLGYSFSILISEGSYTDRFEFLTALKDVLQQRLQRAQEVAAQQIVKQWQVPFDDPWLEAFPAYSGKRLMNTKCMFPKCSSVQPERDLFKHCKEQHKIVGHKFSCSKCALVIPECSDWDLIEEHIKMHDANLFVCCVCKFHHFDRHTFSQHVYSEHNLRDAPALRLMRSDSGTIFGISVVFALARKSFSTTTSCFCCSAENISMDTFLLHLKTAHNLKFKYFCDICDKNIPLLERCEKHFEEHHEKSRFKIRAEIRTSSKVLISTVMPLTFKVIGGISNETSVRIKQEVEDVYLLDEDDVLIAQESNTSKEDAIALPSVGKIRVKHFNVISAPEIYMPTPSTSPSTPSSSTPSTPSSSTKTPSLDENASSSSWNTHTVGKIKIINFNSVSEHQSNTLAQTVNIPSQSTNTISEAIIQPSTSVSTPINAPAASFQGSSPPMNSSSESTNTTHPSARAPILSALIAQPQKQPTRTPVNLISQSINITSAAINTINPSIYAPSISTNQAMNNTNPAMRAARVAINTSNRSMQISNSSANTTNSASSSTMYVNTTSMNAPNRSIFAPNHLVYSTNQSMNNTNLAMNAPSAAISGTNWAMQMPNSSMNATIPTIIANSSSMYAPSISVNSTSMNAPIRSMYAPSPSFNALQSMNNRSPVMNPPRQQINASNWVTQTPSSSMNTPRPAMNTPTNGLNQWCSRS